jgi:hypothetical protein
MQPDEPRTGHVFTRYPRTSLLDIVSRMEWTFGRSDMNS